MKINATKELISFLNEGERRAYYRVISLNNRWSSELGWNKREIERFVLGAKELLYNDFVNGVLNWQYRQGFPQCQTDGIIGPFTYSKMLESSKLLSEIALARELNRFNQILRGRSYSKKLDLSGNDVGKYLKTWTIIEYASSDLFKDVQAINISKDVKINTIFKLSKIWKKISGNVNGVKFYKISLNTSGTFNHYIQKGASFSNRITSSDSFKAIKGFTTMIEGLLLADKWLNGKEIKASTIYESLMFLISFEPLVGRRISTAYSLGNIAFDFSGKLDYMSDELYRALSGDYNYGLSSQSKRIIP